MIVRSALACLIVFGVLSVVFFTACNRAVDSLCGNGILQTVRSPDGTLKAVIFERGCGATTGYSEQVSVLPAGDALPNRAGNVFVADSNHGAAPDGPQVKASWQSADHLRIAYHKKARVFAHLRQVRVKTGWFSGRDVGIAYNQ